MAKPEKFIPKPLSFHQHMENLQKKIYIGLNEGQISKTQHILDPKELNKNKYDVSKLTSLVDEYGMVFCYPPTSSRLEQGLQVANIDPTRINNWLIEYSIQNLLGGIMDFENYSGGKSSKYYNETQNINRAVRALSQKSLTEPRNNEKFQKDLNSIRDKLDALHKKTGDVRITSDWGFMNWFKKTIEFIANIKPEYATTRHQKITSMKEQLGQLQNFHKNTSSPENKSSPK